MIAGKEITGWAVVLSLGNDGGSTNPGPAGQEELKGETQAAKRESQQRMHTSERPFVRNLPVTFYPPPRIHTIQPF